MLYSYKAIARDKNGERGEFLYVLGKIEGLIEVEHNENDTRPDKVRIQHYLNQEYEDVKELEVKPVPTI